MRTLVINTSPIIALVAALGDLQVLKMYEGEAAVIQLALDENFQTVCIDEAAGRRIARLNGLLVTGSVGILLRALHEGYSFSMREAIGRMRTRDIWLSDRVVTFALTQAGEE